MSDHWDDWGDPDDEKEIEEWVQSLGWPEPGQGVRFDEVLGRMAAKQLTLEEAFREIVIERGLEDLYGVESRDE
jgi:hypothetical protein